MSSSSSSSSSSLPRNSLDVKKSYLASIESLDDDDDDDDVQETKVSSREGGTSGGGGGGGAPNANSAVGKPRWCDPNLSHTDRVILEIVDTEKTYVRDLNEIIEVQFQLSTISP